MKKKKSDKIYGVLGLGRFGSSVACELAMNGEEVLAVDNREEPVRAVREYTENAYVCERVDAQSLREVGFAECDTVVVCIGERIDISLLAVLNVMNLGVRRVIAKASTTDHGLLLEKIGAQVIYPERDMGVSLARRLSSRNILESISLANDVDITEVAVPERLVGRDVAHSGIRAEYSLNIIAIRRGDKTIINIHPNEVLEEGDVLLMIGANADLDRFIRKEEA